MKRASALAVGDIVIIPAGRGVSTEYRVISKARVSKQPKCLTLWLEKNGETHILACPVTAFVETAAGQAYQ